MDIKSTTKNYFFTIFKPNKAIAPQSKKIRTLAILSLFTVVVPLGFAITLGVSSALKGRVRKVEDSDTLPPLTPQALTPEPQVTPPVEDKVEEVRARMQEEREQRQKEQMEKESAEREAYQKKIEQCKREQTARMEFDREVTRMVALPEDEFYSCVLNIEDSKLMLACINGRSNFDWSQLTKDIFTSEAFLASYNERKMMQHIRQNSLEDTYRNQFFEAWGDRPLELLKVSSDAFKLIMPLFTDEKVIEIVQLLDANTIGRFNYCFSSQLEKIQRLGLANTIIRLSKESKELNTKLSDFLPTQDNPLVLRDRFRLYYSEHNGSCNPPERAADLLMGDLPLLSVEQVRKLGVAQLGRAIVLIKPEVLAGVPASEFSEEQKKLLITHETSLLSAEQLTAWRSEIEPRSFGFVGSEVLLQLDWSEFSASHLNEVASKPDFIEKLSPEMLKKVWSRLTPFWLYNVRNRFTDAQLTHIIETSEPIELVEFAANLREYNYRKIVQLGLGGKIIEALKKTAFFDKEAEPKNYNYFAIYIADCKDPYEGSLEDLKPKDIALLTVEQVKAIGVKNLPVLFLKKEVLQVFEPSEFTDEQAASLVSYRILHISNAQLFAWSRLLRRGMFNDVRECDPDLVKRIDWDTVISDMKNATWMYAQGRPTTPQ